MPARSAPSKRGPGAATELAAPSGTIRAVESAFFEPAGQDTYVATTATVGPWFPGAQHGGPPSALAARALELHEPDPRQRLARVTIDLLRPVPVGKLAISARTVRPGRRVALVEAVMEADGQEVLHARGWRIERPAGDVPEVTDGSLPESVPLASAGLPPHIFTADPVGYLAAIEWRFLGAGPGPGAPGGQAPATSPVRAVWTRPRITLLPGEEMPAMSRALLVADSGSGVGAALPASRYIYINVDHTVVLPRDPSREWLNLESSTVIGADGTGLATTRLADPLGSCGSAWQTLLVAPR